MIDISRVLEMDGTTMWDSIKYLVISLVKTASRNSLWTPMMDKFKARIMAWGTNWLNKAGKLILINSVLTAMPIYQASILLAPKGIVKDIDRLLRKFLWEGGRNKGRKMHLSVGIRSKPQRWKEGWKSNMWPCKMWPWEERFSGK